MEVSEQPNAAPKAAAMPGTKMSLGAVGGEEMLTWDMQNLGKTAPYREGAAAHWTFVVSTLDRKYRTHRNRVNSQLILTFTNPSLDR